MFYFDFLDTDMTHKIQNMDHYCKWMMFCNHFHDLHSGGHYAMTLNSPQNYYLQYLPHMSQKYDQSIHILLKEGKYKVQL